MRAVFLNEPNYKSVYNSAYNGARKNGYWEILEK